MILLLRQGVMVSVFPFVRLGLVIQMVQELNQLKSSEEQI